jgi:glycosyltransferase involved in cell wall biosynthesis
MNICLLSALYPPINTEGISRQRQVLATELARQGHQVHVITCGSQEAERYEDGVHIHQVLPADCVVFSDKFEQVNRSITNSYAMYEGLKKIASREQIEIVDAPLWSAQGLVPSQYFDKPVVTWLQTSLSQIYGMRNVAIGEFERTLLSLDRLCLTNADGVLADSSFILENIKQDYQYCPDVPTGIVHLGLPASKDAHCQKPETARCQALVVGRLEQRKGTPQLLEVLPAILKKYPHLHIRFVGRDNSQNDGWQISYGLDYEEYFYKKNPGLKQRVVFSGYVKDQDLEQIYAEADFLIVPSLFESFGLIYLEAMRAALPVVTFAVGAACEIFPRKQKDGALLADDGNWQMLSEFVGQFVDSPGLRYETGQNGLLRFREAFTATHMANATIQFYQSVINHHKHKKNGASRVYQVMDALDKNDAVSNITRQNAAFLDENGHPEVILARYAHPDVAFETQPLHTALSLSNPGLIFHYWNYNHSTWMLRNIKGPKALYYHNITPPHYFLPNTPNHEATSRGYKQLKHLVDGFDLLIGDSFYNLKQLAGYITSTKPAIQIPPVVHSEKLLQASFDRGLFADLKRSGTNILFAGRIARNKRQDVLMHLFNDYCTRINPGATLWLVGNDQNDKIYRAELEALRLSLPAGQRIVFTGKVSNEELYAYYRAADIFVSASEHEGFCIPLIEAMAFQVPVMAYAAAAIPETMGKAGIIIDQWDIPRVAELMYQIISDKIVCRKIIAGQNQNLDRFTQQQAAKRFDDVFAYLMSGEVGEYITFLAPHS